MKQLRDLTDKSSSPPRLPTFVQPISGTKAVELSTSALLSMCRLIAWISVDVDMVDLADEFKTWYDARGRDFILGAHKHDVAASVEPDDPVGLDTCFDCDLVSSWVWASGNQLDQVHQMFNPKAFTASRYGHSNVDAEGSAFSFWRLS